MLFGSCAVGFLDRFFHDPNKEPSWPESPIRNAGRAKRNVYLPPSKKIFRVTKFQTMTTAVAKILTNR